MSKIQKWPILAQIDPNLTQIWAFRSSKIKKKNFLLFLQKSKKNYFGQKKSTFHHFYPLHDFPLPTLRKFFLEFFSKTAHWNFLIFCTKSSLWSRKKMTVSLLCLKFKNDPFWPKLTQIWPKYGQFGRQKFLFYLFFFSKNEKKLSWAKKSTFHHFYPHYDLPLPTLSKFLKCLKLRFSHFFREKKWKIYFLLFFVKYGEYSCNFLPFYYTQIGPFLTKNCQN